MSEASLIPTLRIARQSAETTYDLLIEPRTRRTTTLPLPNRLLSHFLDHFMQASGLTLTLGDMRWPGSWRFDHVLCEDMGQLVGHAVAAVQEHVATRWGVRGRSDVHVCMDESHIGVTLSFESRPRTQWVVASRLDINGFVDAWYDEQGTMVGWTTGTNLQQFIDGFAIGAGATLVISIRRTSNLHHLYESIFRGLGDSVREALGLPPTAGLLPGDTSGLAGAPRYCVQRTDEVQDA